MAATTSGSFCCCSGHPCVTSINIEWDGESRRYYVKIEFENPLVADAYQKLIEQNVFHRRRRTTAEIEHKTLLCLSLPKNVVRIRTNDKHRGFIFVFSSPSRADNWKQNTPLWRHYIRGQRQLYIERCTIGSENEKIERLVGQAIKKREKEKSPPSEYVGGRPVRKGVIKEEDDVDDVDDEEFERIQREEKDKRKEKSAQGRRVLFRPLEAQDSIPIRRRSPSSKHRPTR